MCIRDSDICGHCAKYYEVNKGCMQEDGCGAVSYTHLDVYKRQPAISEQIYTLEDALLFAEMQMVIIRNADAIKICLLYTSRCV